MTAYQGGKKRTARRLYQKMKEIESELYPDLKLPYLEPFCGMCSVLSEAAKDGGRELTACDANPDIILFWRAVKNGWRPPSECTPEEYRKLKYGEPSPLRTFVGYAGSYAAEFFRGSGNFTAQFVEKGQRAVARVADFASQATFLDAKPYDEFNPLGMMVYCDPPYIGNKLTSKWFRKFDHEKFWNVMRKWSEDNLVFISEWKAPEDFVSIYSIPSSSWKHKNGKVSTKRWNDQLYVHKSIADKLPK